MTWVLISERETETATYRMYEDGLTRMEVISSKLPDIVLPTRRVPAPRLHPGNAAAADAFKAGLEDEYIDGMRNRYEGDW